MCCRPVVQDGDCNRDAVPPQIESAVRPLMQLYFPASTGVSLVAEPGAFFVSSAFTLAVSIVAKEVVSRDRWGQSHGTWAPL